MPDTSDTDLIFDKHKSDSSDCDTIVFRLWPEEINLASDEWRMSQKLCGTGVLINPSQFSRTQESKDDDNLPSAHTDCEVLIPNNQDTLQKCLSNLELYTIYDWTKLVEIISLCFQSSNVDPILTISFLCDKHLEEAHKHVHSRKYNTDIGDLITTMFCNAFKVHAKIYRCGDGEVSTIEQKPWYGDAITTIHFRKRCWSTL